MDLYKALEWYCRQSPSIYNCGETYESLKWESSNKLSQPTMSDLEKAWEEYLEERNKNVYKVLRSNEYIPLQDQLDMIYNHGLDAWMEYIQSIKNKYPSPNSKDKPIRINPMDKMKDQLETLIADTDKRISAQSEDITKLRNALNETQSAILAIKGFMMEIPVISKQLQELKESINNNFTSK
jgi:hypothetical protein